MKATADTRRWTALVVLSVCVLVPFMDVTTTSIDLPKITRELSITWVGAQWAVGGYLLVCGVGMLIVPAIGDRWGYRRALLVGMALFGSGAVVAALAPGAGVFIAGRIAMGVGAATVLPAWLSITAAMFPAEERKRAFAVSAAFVSTATPLGPIVGGALLDHAWYGSLFLLDAVIAVVVIPFIVGLTPETATGAGRWPDLTGIGLAAGTAGALFCAFTAAAGGWWIGAWLSAAAVLLAGFVVRERRAADPLLDLTVLRRGRFVWSQLTISTVNFAWTGLLFLLPTYFLVIRGSTALGVALLLVPLAAMAGVASAITGRVSRRLGVRGTVVAGLLLFTAGLTVLSSLIAASSDYVPMVAALALSGLGAGLPQAPALGAAMGELTERSAGNGPGVINAFRHIGGALGAAAAGFVVATTSTNALPTTAYTAFTDGVSTSLRGGAALLLALVVLTMVLPDRTRRHSVATTK